jgi:hypothetical protein
MYTYRHAQAMTMVRNMRETVIMSEMEKIPSRQGYIDVPPQYCVYHSFNER